MNQFTPSKEFAKELLEQPLQRVGEHPSYISDEEMSYNKEEPQSKVTARDMITEEFD